MGQALSGPPTVVDAADARLRHDDVVDRDWSSNDSEYPAWEDDSPLEDDRVDDFEEVPFTREDGFSTNAESHETHESQEIIEMGESVEDVDRSLSQIDDSFTDHEAELILLSVAMEAVLNPLRHISTGTGSVNLISAQTAAQSAWRLVRDAADDLQGASQALRTYRETLTGRSVGEVAPIGIPSDGNGLLGEDVWSAVAETRRQLEDWLNTLGQIRSALRGDVDQLVAVLNTSASPDSERAQARSANAVDLTGVAVVNLVRTRDALVRYQRSAATRSTEHDQIAAPDWSSTPPLPTPERATAPEPLAWMLPQLAEVSELVEVLADARRGPEHPIAARNILDALNRGARTLLDSAFALPRMVAPATDRVSKIFLRELGDYIDEAVNAQGLSWPPPREEPPPSVTRDLIYLYEHASSWHDPDELDIERLLRRKLERVATLSLVLSERWDGSRGLESSRRVIQTAAGSTGSKAATFLSGLALLISLIQGPGAFHDLPGDVRELGTDIASVTATVAKGVARVADEIADGLREP